MTDANEDYKGSGYSVNGEFRVSHKWNILGKYDYFEMDNDSTEKKRAIAGISYEYNHNIEFIFNYLTESGNAISDTRSGDSLMLTAQVEW